MMARRSAQACSVVLSRTGSAGRAGGEAIRLALHLVITASAVAPLAAQAGTPPSAVVAASTWLCRPGRIDACAADLDAVRVEADGMSATAPYRPAAQPGVDCFYVYPTASLEPSTYSDLLPGPGETAVARHEAARLGAQCRVFAPMYRQLTIAGLKVVMAHTPAGAPPDFDIDRQYGDLLAAWRDYLAHDNHGRGVVLVGHSQGSILLKRLIAEQIDGKPVQALLVAAFLAGNADLGREAFRAIPPCAAATQTGCVIAWSSYPLAYDGPRAFGGDGPDGPAVCVNPAALDGRDGMVTAYLPNPSAASAAPDLEVVGLLKAACVRDGRGDVLRVSIPPGAGAARIAGAVAPSRAGPSWGYHPLDIPLVQGDMLRLIAAEAAAWETDHGQRR